MSRFDQKGRSIPQISKATALNLAVSDLTAEEIAMKSARRKMEIREGRGNK